MCGEQLVYRKPARNSIGSPPRVRGTEMHDMYQRFHIGITPACAGNSYLSLFFTTPIQDHPRVCGEQAARPGRMHPALGSPPRVRGTAFSFSLLAIDTRITPACAGNSCFHNKIFNSNWDHPRVCGEQQGDTSIGSRAKGSPPRVRGTASRSTCSKSVKRITPACAGNRIRFNPL